MIHGRFTEKEFVLATGQKRPRKYRNRPQWYDGHYFDSQVEIRRYQELKILEQAEQIERLRVHNPVWTIVVNGVLITSYEPDFTYYNRGKPDLVVEDVKSEPTLTDFYKTKKALMRALFGVEIQEIEYSRKRRR